jgi:flagellar basal body-associated protein FliL
MVSKDQSIGGVIFIICIVIAAFYLITLFYPTWLSSIGINVDTAWMSQVQFWIIAVPVFVAFIGIMGIGAWIGWTMATTPPPKPIEEITSEMSEEKEEAKTEETPPPPAEEEKKPERRKKSEKQTEES